MSRRLLLFILLTAALSVPAVSSAHQGHVHKVTGTVTLRQDQRVEVRTQDGKTVVVTLNPKTTFELDARKVTDAELLVGRRVVVDVGDGKEPLVARSIKLGVLETPSAKK